MTQCAGRLASLLAFWFWVELCLCVTGGINHAATKFKNGAVAGAAVSVEALDLARLCFSGYSVAGAMERREGRLRGVYGNS